jgi:hypothetical protein
MISPVFPYLRGDKSVTLPSLRMARQSLAVSLTLSQKYSGPRYPARTNGFVSFMMVILAKRPSSRKFRDAKTVIDIRRRERPRKSINVHQLSMTAMPALTACCSLRSRRWGTIFMRGDAGASAISPAGRSPLPPPSAEDRPPPSRRKAQADGNVHQCPPTINDSIATNDTIVSNENAA